MDSASTRALLEEGARRARVSAAPVVDSVIQGIRAEMFGEQLALVDDPSREKAALCTRRAGKTEAEHRYGPMEALKYPGSLVRYWSITRQRCKELYWLPLKAVFERAKVSVKWNDSELRGFLPNRSEIRLVGADKDKEAQKKRGDKTRLEVIGEAQAFGPFLKSLVEDVVEPCTVDVRGTMLLSGTPSVICAGHWFSVSGSQGHVTAKRWHSPGRTVKAQLEGQGWSCHRWSVLDNPHMQHMREDLPALKAKRGWDDKHPTYLREWLAQWVSDNSALFYAFDETRNLHTRPEAELRGPGWVHVLGWDLGSGGANDPMAKVVWAFHPDDPCLYEAFSWKDTALLEECNAVDRDLDKRFNLVGRVADTGGGGKLFVQQYARRFPGFPYEAAKKTEKYEHVILFNDDLKSSRIKLREGSELHQEMSTLPKDPDVAEELSAKEDSRFPNHCCDSGLYGWRRGFHFLHTPEEDAPPPGTPAAFEAEAKRMEEQHVAEHQQQAEQPWWEA